MTAHTDAVAAIYFIPMDNGRTHVKLDIVDGRESHISAVIAEKIYLALCAGIKNDRSIEN